jgi:hypothetical protein
LGSEATRSVSAPQSNPERFRGQGPEGRPSIAGGSGIAASGFRHVRLTRRDGLSRRAPAMFYQSLHRGRVLTSWSCIRPPPCLADRLVTGVDDTFGTHKVTRLASGIVFLCLLFGVATVSDSRKLGTAGPSRRLRSATM